MEKKISGKKILTLTMGVLLVGALLTGCGGNSSNEQQAAAVDKGPVQVTYKKNVVVASSAKITNTDPQSVNNVQHKRLFLLTHNTLIYSNPETNEISPNLAESWKMSDDLITWEIKLRQGVKFHNGEEFTADDVVFSIERGKESAIGSAKFMFQYVDRIDVIDDYNIKIVLKAPNMDWEQILTQPGMSMLNREAVQADEKNGASVGTGAWKHKEFKEGDYVLLERFDGYWGELPKTETLKVSTIPEASARLIALQNGEIDVCMDPNNAELSFIADDDKLELVQYKGTNLIYFAFNVSKAPGNDQKLRQAIAHAINYDDIIMGAYESFATKATSFWGWHQTGYAADLKGYDYNLERAKQLMAESGYSGGVTLKIMTTGKERVTAAQIIQAQLKEIGITVEVVEVDSAGFTSQTNASEHEACLYGITYATFADDARRTYRNGSTTNKSFQNNQRIHEIMDVALAEPDLEKRMSLYHEWQEVANEECAVIPLFYTLGATGINKNAGGILYEPGGIHDFKNIYVKE